MLKYSKILEMLEVRRQ